MVNVKDAKDVAEEVGMAFFVNEERGTARLYYKDLDIPEELYWVDAILKAFIQQNPNVTVTAVTEIHERLRGESLWAKIKNLFQKSNPIGVLIVYKKG